MTTCPNLCQPFRRILAKFGLAAVSGLVPAADKAKESPLNFDLTLTQHLTFLREFKECIRILSL